jgi:6-phosphogluconate dehydrogenase
LLKGGTTVSVIAEELVEIPLRICGRISKRGIVTSQIVSGKHPHSILVEKGKLKNIDDSVVEVVKNFRRGDIIIISGNAQDSQKNVGLMARSVSGGNPGIAVSGMLTEGAEV